MCVDGQAFAFDESGTGTEVQGNVNLLRREIEHDEAVSAIAGPAGRQRWRHHEGAGRRPQRDDFEAVGMSA